MKKRYLKLIAIYLVLVIFFVGIVPDTQKVEAAVAVPAVPIAVGAFILLAASVGVTFNAVEEAERMLNDFEKQNPPPPNLTPFALIATLLGAKAYQHAEDIKNWANQLKNYFKNKEEIRNTIIVGLDEFVPFDTTKNILVFDFKKKIGAYFKLEQNFTYWDSVDLGPYYDFKDIYSDKKTGTPLYFYNSSGATLTGFTFTRIEKLSGYDQVQVFYDIHRSDGSRRNAFSGSRPYGFTLIDSTHPYIHDYDYNIKPDSPILTDKDVELKQPSIENITEKKVKNDGTSAITYDGDLQQMIDDLLKNLNLQNPVTDKNYEIDEDPETGKVIIEDIDSNPFEDPDTNTETGLLQSIINWLKRIWEKIPVINTDLKPDPADPADPSEPENLEIDTSKLKLNQFHLKFPFSIPWDLYNCFAVFAQSAKDPELVIDLDTEYFQIYHEIDTTKIALPIAFFRYAVVIFFVMFLANKTRDLIKW